MWLIVRRALNSTHAHRCVHPGGEWFWTDMEQDERVFCIPRNLPQFSSWWFFTNHLKDIQLGSSPQGSGWKSRIFELPPPTSWAPSSYKWTYNPSCRSYARGPSCSFCPKKNNAHNFCQLDRWQPRSLINRIHPRSGWRWWRSTQMKWATKKNLTWLSIESWLVNRDP